MQLSQRQVNGVTVIDVASDLGPANPSALREFVKATLERGERRIVLNVSQITGLDSTCLGEIFASYKAATMLGGVLRLAEPNAHFRRVLHVTKLDTFIDAHDTEAEAIASFGAGSRVP